MESNPPIDDLLSDATVPFGELIASVGQGVADAQEAMDRATLERMQMLLADNGELASLLRAMGWQPTWYHIPEAEANLTMTLSVSSANRTGPGAGKLALRATPMNATNISRYNVNINLASSLRFRVVPVPNPGGLEQTRRVPELLGLDATEAIAALEAQGFVPNVRGEGVVCDQSPTANTWAREGDRVAVYLSK